MRGRKRDKNKEREKKHLRDERVQRGLAGKKKKKEEKEKKAPEGREGAKAVGRNACLAKAAAVRSAHCSRADCTGNGAVIFETNQ